MLKCDKCGYEGSRSEFRYVSQACQIGPATYRRCPQCGRLVYCGEMEEDERIHGVNVWGLSKLKGQRFPGKKREEGKKG